MSETDAAGKNIGRSDGRQQGRQKIESWVPHELKNEAEGRADELDIPMAEYIRQLVRADVGRVEEIEG